jgi:hypothetical protein
MGINPNNKITIIIRMLFAVTLFQHHLQPYKQNSLKAEHCQKLAPKFYGPYIVLKHVGQVAYQLALPIHSKLHPIFHVSCLKKVIETKCQIQSNLPELAEEGSI